MTLLQAFWVVSGVCAIAGTCTLHVAQSTAQCVKKGHSQAERNASPIYGAAIPVGYRDWRLISVKQPTGREGRLRQLRAQLGNDLATTAFREGKLSSRDGAIIAALYWNEVSSDADNQVLARHFPTAGLDLPLPGSQSTFNSWPRTQKSPPRPAAGDTPTLPTANLAMRLCTKDASLATGQQKIATTFSLTTHLRRELNRAGHYFAAQKLSGVYLSLLAGRLTLIG